MWHITSQITELKVGCGEQIYTSVTEMRTGNCGTLEGCVFLAVKLPKTCKKSIIACWKKNTFGFQVASALLLSDAFMS